MRRAAFEAVGGFDGVVRFPGEEERVALDLASAGWGLAYVDWVTVHHHPSVRRHSPDRREAAIWRSRLLTGLMRRPWAEAGRLVLGALRNGRPGRAGLLRALPDVPAALAARRPLPPEVLAHLRLLRGDPA